MYASGPEAYGQFKPDAGAAEGRADTPARCDLIDQEEAPATGRVAACRPRRRFEVGPRVDDLHANPVGLAPKFDVHRPVGRSASVTHGVGDELGHEERDVVAH